MEIVARDAHGEEHCLKVTVLAGGLISVRDDEVVRVLAPCAAWELGLLLLRCAKRHDEDGADLVRAEVG